MHRLEMLPPYYGDGDDELHLAFNLPWLHADFRAEALRAVVEETERILPTGAWPVWTGSNLDTSRLATRWADGHPGMIRCILLALLTLRGTPVIYQGDEIGLPDATMTEEALRDPVGRRYWPTPPGATPSAPRSPGTTGPGGGFTVAGVEHLAAHEHPTRVQRGRPTRRSRFGPHLHPRPHRPPPVQPRSALRRLPDACRRPPTPGCGSGATGSPPPSTSGTDAATFERT